MTKLIYDFAEDEKGKYVDFCSLYPSVNFFKEYPVGYPEKIYSPGKYSRKWFGYIKCKVLPPQELCSCSPDENKMRNCRETRICLVQKMRRRKEEAFL